MRQKKYACLLLCLIIAIMPIISLAEGEQEKSQEPAEVAEQSTENSNEEVQETPVVEETKEVEKETSNEQVNTETETKEEAEQPEQEETKEEVKKEEEVKESTTKEKSEDKVEQKTEEKIQPPTIEADYSVNNGSTAAYVGETKTFDPAIGTVLRYPLPSRGIITTYFGAMDSLHPTGHTGLDLAISQGTPVLACESGKVIYASWWGGGGNTVQVEHPDGMVTVYCHMSQINVQVGESVIRGQQLGLVGSTGHSTGPHLHLEVYPNGLSGVAVNPLPYLEKDAKDEETEYANVKFLFVDKENKNNIVDKLITFLKQEIASTEASTNVSESKEETVELQAEAVEYDDILFQLNERLPIEILDGKTIIDISDYYNNGLIVEDPILILSKEGREIEFISENNELTEKTTIGTYKLVVNEEVKQSEMQLIIPSKKITKSTVLTYINSEFPTIESNIMEFSPLFDMRLKLGIKDITVENIEVKVDDKLLPANYYEYTGGELIIHYSSLNISELTINITKEKHELSSNLEIKNNINSITTWIETSEFNPIKLNSAMNECYFVSSLLNNDIESDFNTLPYTRYNFDKNGNEIVSQLLIDNQLADGFISIPVNQFKTEMKITAETDPKSYSGDTQPSEELIIENKNYNIFIYGEKLNILDDTQFEDGYKTVNFKILDYATVGEDTYFIIEYQMEGIGGYFGIHVN